MRNNLKGRNFLKLLDFSTDEINDLLELSVQLKQDKKDQNERQLLKNRNIALIFEKTSTRTRCAFEVAAYDQGAHITYLGPTGSQIGHKESMKDTARVLSRFYDGIEYRGFGQKIVEELAAYAGVPVWNGLTNEFHPTQVLADLLTMKEHNNKNLEESTFCFMGDARYNMGNSLLTGGVKMGMDVRIASPKSLQPSNSIIDTAVQISKETHAKVLVTEDIQLAVKDCDFIITDVWVSMGEPDDVWLDRINLLKDYQVNSAVMEKTNNPDVKFMHCLPAFHNRETKIGEEIFKKFGMDALEVTDEVFESDASIVFDEAENRLHTAKAVMVATLCDLKN